MMERAGDRSSLPFRQVLALNGGTVSLSALLQLRVDLPCPRGRTHRRV